jgi:hypothetical protein
LAIFASVVGDFYEHFLNQGFFDSLVGLVNQSTGVAIYGKAVKLFQSDTVTLNVFVCCTPQITEVIGMNWRSLS